MSRVNKKRRAKTEGMMGHPEPGGAAVGHRTDGEIRKTASACQRQLALVLAQQEVDDPAEKCGRGDGDQPRLPARPAKPQAALLRRHKARRERDDFEVAALDLAALVVQHPDPWVG